MTSLSDQFEYQLSVSLPPSEQFAKGDMVNIRGNSAPEFQQNLLDFNAHMAELAATVVAEIRAKWTVVRDLGGQTIASEPNNYGPPQGQQAPQQYQAPWHQQAPQAPDGIPTQPPPNVGQAPQCSHGEKKFIAKPYKNGKPGYWMAWSCPARQGDTTQHPLEFIK